MGQLIEGKVAQILSEDILIINVGSAAGVKVGMAFAVLAQGDEVKDPDTGDILGRWEVPKGCIRATHVQERISTCRGFSPELKSAESEDPSTRVLSAAMITHSMHPESWRGKGGARMNVNRSQVAGMPTIGPISVGDVVRQLATETPATPPAGTAQPESAPDASKEPDKREKAQ